MTPLAWSPDTPVVAVRELIGVDGRRFEGPRFRIGETPARFELTGRPEQPLALAVSCAAFDVTVRIDGASTAMPSNRCGVDLVPIPASAWEDGRVEVELGLTRWLGAGSLGELEVGPPDLVRAVAEARRWEAAAEARLVLPGWVGWLMVAAGHLLVGTRMRDRSPLLYGGGLGIMAAGELGRVAWGAGVGPLVPYLVTNTTSVIGTVLLTIGMATFFGWSRRWMGVLVAVELLGLNPDAFPALLAAWVLACLTSLATGLRQRRAETGWLGVALVCVLPFNLAILAASLGYVNEPLLSGFSWLYLATPPITGTGLLVHRHLATWSNAQRFVPADFLRALGHTDVAELSFGDHVERTMVVWFSDVRGFTALVEGLPPVEVQRLVALALGTQEEVIRRHGGFVDKYIGDAVMALFDDPDAAMAAAVEARRLVAERDGGRLAVGIGLHRGPVLLGTVGNAHRMDCTVIGDHVNLASRVEGATRRYGAAILVTGAVRDAATRPVISRPVERVVVKGRSEAVELHELLDPALDGERLSVADEVAAARAALDAGDPVVAEPGLRALATAHPDDGVVARLLERCEAWLRDGVPDEPAVVRLTEK